MIIHAYVSKKQDLSFWKSCLWTITFHLWICAKSAFFVLISLIIYNPGGFWKGFFIFYYVYIFFMMATQFSHNSFLYFKYIIRKGNGTFVSSAYLKLQSFFILIPGSPKLPGPPKTFSFILYTYHSQNQRAKRTAKPFRPLIFLFFPFLFSVPSYETATAFCTGSGQPQSCCR